MKRILKYATVGFTAAATGAAMMYLLDPDRGRTRRQRLRSSARGSAHDLQRATGKSLADLTRRFEGVLAETRAHFQCATVDDELLVQRVRSALGHVVSHPHAIDVVAREGAVLLRGPILKTELAPALATARKVKGVRSLRSWLHARESAAHISALQGGKPRLPAKLDLLNPRWAPGTRLLMGAAGAGLAAMAALRRDWTGTAARLVGGGLMLRAASNRRPGEWLGVGTPATIEVEKTININAPLADVYEFWANPENYPLALTHVKKVEKVGEGRYRWTVAGPAGVEVGWEGVITRKITNELLAWQSMEGSLVGNQGSARFDPNYDGSMRLTIRLAYQPPAGMFGHMMAVVFGSDPARMLDSDLARMKSMFEQGGLGDDSNDSGAEKKDARRFDAAEAVARIAGT